MEDTGFTLEGRVLCPDDACTGTVGPDRRCKLCGTVYEGPETPGEASGRRETPPVAPPPADAPAVSGASSDGGGVEEDRVCCPDDACTGVIGPDGKCGVCGKRAP